MYNFLILLLFIITNTFKHENSDVDEEPAKTKKSLMIENLKHEKLFWEI